jgi:hypothetical protein
MQRRPILVPLLCVTILLLVVPAARAQPATQTAPSAPEQPASGPGGSDYAYDRVVAAEYGEGAGGFLLFEPAEPVRGGTPAADAPLPIVLFLSACCETDELSDVNDEGAPWRAWIDHLVRRGAVVVYPRYAFEDPMTGVVAAVKSALTELAAGSHPPTDSTRLVAVGHSFGGVLTVQYAAIAADRGLPVPLALMPTTPVCGFCPQIGDASSVPAATRLLVVVAEDDGHELSREFWDELAHIPADRKDWVVVRTDRHGDPPLVADHGMPATDVFGAVDSLDWYGTWKLFDALVACSLDGNWCESALGNTPEQRFMGTWSDGTPVVELDVTDDPGAGS